MKFLATMMETIIGVAIFKSIVFTLLYNVFRLPPISGHYSTNKLKTFNFISLKKGGGVIKCTAFKIMLPKAVIWVVCAVTLALGRN